MDKKDVLDFIKKLNNFKQNVKNDNKINNIPAESQTVDKLYKLINGFGNESAKDWLESSGIITKQAMKDKLNEKVQDMAYDDPGNVMFSSMDLQDVANSQGKWFDNNLEYPDPVDKNSIIDSIQYIIDAVKCNIPSIVAGK